MKWIVAICAMILVVACGGGNNDSGKKSPSADQQVANDKGIGEITHVDLNDPLDAGMVKRGESIYQMKCAACHKLTEMRVVGPGFKGVTERRTPEWIMNMTTNVEVMLAEDPAALELLKECLVRMPNQNLSIGDARDVLELMYQNDGYAVGEE